MTKTIQGIEGAVTNPSYDKRLSAGKRMADFLGAYHIILNGVKAHERFDLRHEGRPDEYCDTDDKKRFIEFVERLVKDALSQQATALTKEIVLRISNAYQGNDPAKGAALMMLECSKITREILKDKGEV